LWGFFNISATAETSDFKFGTQLGFAKIHHKITPREKRKGGLGLGELLNMLAFSIIFLQRLEPATSDLACGWSLPRPTIKSHTKDRVGMALS